MERSSKRGKIPQRDWPSIMARHQAGETLASIARTYDCSPPAISYIVSRSRARNAGAQPPGLATPSIGEPQLIKSHALEAPAAAAAAVADRQAAPIGAASEPVSAMAPPAPRPAFLEPERPAPRFIEQPPHPLPEGRPELRTRDGNGLVGRPHPGYAESPAPTYGERQPPAADSRRTLHLSLGGAEPAPPVAERQPPAPPPNRPAPAQAAPPVRMLPETAKGRDGSGGIDQALRERIESDIAAFLSAFDAALAGDTPETRSGLREATDRLLRAGARTRIELERLEARVPLPPRERRDHEPVEWRHR